MPREFSDTLWRLLPRNSSTLERNVLKTTGFDALLDEAADTIRTAKFVDQPALVLPWVAMEFGLARFSEFQTDPVALIEEGLAVLKKRGTADAVTLAMEWLGLNVTVIEETVASIHFAEWQLDIGEIPTDLSLICRIAKLAQLVQPCRSRLRRILHGLDIPMFYWDDSNLDDAIFDNYSGIWAPDVPGICEPAPKLWLSFRDYDHGICVWGGGASVTAQETPTVTDDTEFATFIADEDGVLSVESGEFVTDPVLPSIEGDITITGEVGIDTETH